jgi:hypothetical protein
VLVPDLRPPSVGESIGAGKRALVVFFTDLVVAGVSDPDLERAIRTPPPTVDDVLAASVVVKALDARARGARRSGSWAPPSATWSASSTGCPASTPSARAASC